MTLIFIEPIIICLLFQSILVFFIVAVFRKVSNNTFLFTSTFPGAGDKVDKVACTWDSFI